MLTIEYKDFRFGGNQAKREIELFEIIYKKNGIEIGALAHNYGSSIINIQPILDDLKDYGLIKIINRRNSMPYGDNAVGIPFKSVILTELGEHISNLLELMGREHKFLKLMHKKYSLAASEIANSLNVEDAKDIIQDFEKYCIIYYDNDYNYTISDLGIRVADLFSDLDYETL